MSDRQRIETWPEKYTAGSKRTHVSLTESVPDWDWFVGYGKDESCQFEGSWWDLVCFARNVLASENTKVAAPEFYKPEWKNNNYSGEAPYEYGPSAKETP